MAESTCPNPTPKHDATRQPNVSLAALARLFLKLGTIGFGGPAAHIAMMEQEVVARRRWIDRQTFLDMIGAANLIPGPNSTELTMFIGRRLAGWPGLLIAGASFIAPAAIIVIVLAWAYLKWGTLPSLQNPLLGIKAAVLALIAMAIGKLAITAVKSHRHLTIALAAAVAAYARWAPDLAILIGGALLGMLWLSRPGGLSFSSPKGKPPLRLMPAALLVGLSQRALASGPLLMAPATQAALPAAVAAATWSQVGFYFLKLGSTLYGSGYVLMAFLQSGPVEQFHWIGQQQLLDAIAVGQFTPGPLFTTATFIGYLATAGGSNDFPAGLQGALAATVGIFLPGFVLVALLAPVLDRLRRWPWAARFLDAVNLTSLALMAVVLVNLAMATLTDWRSGVVTVMAFAALILWQVNSALIIAGAALAGWLLWLP